MVQYEGDAMLSAAKEIPVIRPISDLRVRLNEVCSQATELQEPIILTKNGTAAYMLIDCDAYESFVRETRFRQALREAEIEEKYNPQTLSAQESDAQMRELFALWGLDYPGIGQSEPHHA